MERDLAPNDVVAIDMCGPFTPSLGGNLYMFYGVDHATGYIVNYGLRRKSEALAVFKRCVVDMAHKAGTAVKCVRGDCDALWTSRGFVEFCDSMGIAREHSPPGAQQYNGVAESAIQRCNKVGMASRRSALRRLGPEGFWCIEGMDPRGDRLWAESAKDAAQKLNQSASPSNPGRASPQELFTKKKGPFRVLPFLQEGFMSVTPLNKLENRAVRVFFLNGGDNHASCTVKVINAATGRASYTNSVCLLYTSPSPRDS